MKHMYVEGTGSKGRNRRRLFACFALVRSLEFALIRCTMGETGVLLQSNGAKHDRNLDYVPRGEIKRVKNKE